MPTYEYACQKCGHEFEQFQSMRDEPLKKCPKCKKNFKYKNVMEHQVKCQGLKPIECVLGCKMQFLSRQDLK